MKHPNALIVFAMLCALFSNGCSKQSGEYEWSSLAIGGGGFVSAIITSKTEKGLIYARTDVGGAYRWDPKSERWIPLLDWLAEDQKGYLGVESLAIDPQKPNIVYMLVGLNYFDMGKSAILKSEDYGAHFQIIDTTRQFKAHGNGMGRQNGEKLAVDPNNSDLVYVGTRDHGLFKSSDAGLTWSRLDGLNVSSTPNENGISFVLIDPGSDKGGSSQTIYVGVSTAGTNLYRSNDGGQTFKPVASAPKNFLPQRAALAGNGDLYITYSNGAGPHPHYLVHEPADNGAVWKYNTRNTSWADVTPTAYVRNAFSGISVDPNNPERVILSTINTWLLQESKRRGDRFLFTKNGGKSWTDIIENGFVLDPAGTSWIGKNHSIHWAGSIEFDPYNTNTVWVTSGNGIYRSNNIEASPASWTFMVKGLEETVPLDLASLDNGSLLSVISDFDGFLHQSAKPDHYGAIHDPQMGSTSGLAVAARDNTQAVRVGTSMYFSSDAGKSWVKSRRIQGEYGKVALSADASTIIHSPRNSTISYLSKNKGETWKTVKGLNINNAFPIADPSNSQVFYAYNPLEGSFFSSSDGGESFSKITTTLKSGSPRLALAPEREGDIWVALIDHGLARSTNSGESFNSLSGVTYCGAVGFGIAANIDDYPTLYIWGTVNGVQGVHRSTDEGANWLRINDDEHQYGGPGNGQFVIGDKQHFGRVYMSTAGRGIAYGELVSE